MILSSDLAKIAAESYWRPPSYQVNDLAAWVTSAGPWHDNIISFRGSCNVENWVRDFEAIPRKFNHVGYMHQGFGVAAGQLLAKMPEEIFLPKGGKQIYLVGHSLGGAIALAVASILGSVRKFHHGSVFTFGAPRVGSFKYRHSLKNIPVVQYRRLGDAVPHLVPNLLFTGRGMPIFMFHAGQKYDIGSYEYDPFSAHSINGYIECLLDRESNVDKIIIEE